MSLENLSDEWESSEEENDSVYSSKELEISAELEKQNYAPKKTLKVSLYQKNAMPQRLSNF